MDWFSVLQLEKESAAASRLLRDLVLRVESDRQPSFQVAIQPASVETASSIQSAALRVSQLAGDADLDRDLAG
jgi:hypothetical protein